MNTRNAGPVRRKHGGDIGVTIGSDAMTTKGVDTLLRHACSTGTLRISNRGLKAIPSEVFALQSLAYSDKRWWEEAPLTVLDFSHNEIRDVLSSSTVQPARMAEDFAAMFHALRLLVGSYNVLEAVPTPLLLVCAATITKIDLSHNRLTSFDTFTSVSLYPTNVAVVFPSLVELDLSHNQLLMIDGISAACPQLEKLDLSNNKLTAFESRGFAGSQQQDRRNSFPLLRQLNIHHNQLEAFGPSPLQRQKSTAANVFFFPQLATLDASYNSLSTASLCHELGGIKLPPSLVTLNLQVNTISSLVVDLAGPSASSTQSASLPILVCPLLKELYLGYNKMLSPPPNALEHCPALQMLDASNNAWNDVACVLACPDLSRLDIQNNNLSNLPPQLGFFKKLTALVLDGNPMRAIRRDVVAKGTVELMKYLRSRDESSGTSAPLGVGDNNKKGTTSVAQPAVVTYLAPEVIAATLPQQVGVSANMNAARGRKVDDRPFATELNQVHMSEEDKARDSACLRTGEHTGTLWDLSAKKLQSSAIVSGSAAHARGSRNAEIPSVAADLPAVVNIHLNLKELHARTEDDFRQGVHVIKLCRQTRLEQLDLSFLWPFPNIRELDASECSLLAILSVPSASAIRLTPPAMLPAIQVLNVSKCGLSSASLSSLANLFVSPYAAKLTRVDLSFNKLLSELPNELAALGNVLRSLTLNFCRMTQFPLVLGQLHELCELSMNSCGLTTFPPDDQAPPSQPLTDATHQRRIQQFGFAEGSWPKLQLLDLGNNDLTSVPYSIGRMQSHLRSLVLEGNAIKWLRPQTCAKGTAAVLQFLSDKMPV